MSTNPYHAIPLSPPRSESLPEHVAGAKDQNPAGIGLLALLREDLRTHDNDLFSQGLWAIAVHRFGNWRMNVRPKLLRIPFSIVYKTLNKLVEWTCGISLPYTVRLGRRVRIWHHGGMILHAAAIGNDVQLRQTTTLGVARTNHNFELPTIGDGADLGAHVCILGAVTIGNHAVVGAGAVVLTDVPANHLAVGVPARIVPRPAETGNTGVSGTSPWRKPPACDPDPNPWRKPPACDPDPNPWRKPSACDPHPSTDAGTAGDGDGDGRGDR